MVRKIIYSPGYGAGWSTWLHNVPTDFACEYEPLIEAIENEEDINADHEVMKQFTKEAEEKFDTTIYDSTMNNYFEIKEIEDDEEYKISVYDGNESVEVKSREQWY